jgi:hypothetical protein
MQHVAIIGAPLDSQIGLQSSCTQLGTRCPRLFRFFLAETNYDFRPSGTGPDHDTMKTKISYNFRIGYYLQLLLFIFCVTIFLLGPRGSGREVQMGQRLRSRGTIRHTALEQLAMF